MVAICTRLKSFLDEKGVDYQVVHHAPEFTAQETAADTHTPGREFAKVVVVKADGRFAMAVLPAHHRLDIKKLRDLLGASDIRLAREDEMRELFPDCDVGAEPIFGNLYDLPVYVAASLTYDERITFNAGTHEDVIRIRYKDFEQWVRPTVGELSEVARV